jgi:hypothetical protein
MRLSPPVARIALALILTALAALPAGATTLIRQGLEGLTAENETIVFGRVLDIHSYWNADHSMILTDVRVRPSQVLKGDRAAREVTFTLLGGTVGDITTLIIGGPELVPGSDYVLFLNRELLQGGREFLTVRSLVQGAFDVTGSGAGRKVVSQANAHPLVPDASGIAEPPGGVDGLTLDDMIQRVRSLAGDR